MYSSDDAESSFRTTGRPGDFNLMAYIKPVATDKGTVYGVFAADGTQLAVFASSEAALCAARQHELEPTLIH